jgi:hypothetical protein
MMRIGVAPAWRLRHSSENKGEVVMPLAPRLLSDDMVGLKQAAIAGLGIVTLPVMCAAMISGQVRCAESCLNGSLGIRP